MNEQYFLKPGEYFFGKGRGVVTTILGSCVSIVLWHPDTKLLAVSHILLPSRATTLNTMGMGQQHHFERPCSRFADELFTLFVELARVQRLTLRDFNASLIGGGDMFPVAPGYKSVGQKNLEAVAGLALEHQMNVEYCDTGGSLYRRLSVFIETGDIIVEQSELNYANRLTA